MEVKIIAIQKVLTQIKSCLNIGLSKCTCVLCSQEKFFVDFKLIVSGWGLFFTFWLLIEVNKCTQMLQSWLF